MHLGQDPQFYEEVFSVTSHGYWAWRVALMPAAFGLVMWSLLVVVRRWSAADSEWAVRRFRLIATLASLFGFIVASVLFIYTWGEYRQLSGALRDGDIRTIQGTVAEFRAEEPNGHPQERFRLGDTWFEYSSSDITSSFHWTSGQGA